MLWLSGPWPGTEVSDYNTHRTVYVGMDMGFLQIFGPPEITQNLITFSKKPPKKVQKLIYSGWATSTSQTAFKPEMIINLCGCSAIFALSLFLLFRSHNSLCSYGRSKIVSYKNGIKYEDGSKTICKEPLLSSLSNPQCL